MQQLRCHQPPMRLCLIKSPFFHAHFFIYYFLKKIQAISRRIAIAIAFAGSLFVIKPTLSNVELLPSVAGFLGGVGAGAAYTCVRHMANKGENGTFTVFFFSLFSVICTAPFLIFSFTPMTAKQWICLILVGVCAAGGQFGITSAYTFAPSSKISVYDYSNVIFTAIGGYFCSTISFLTCGRFWAI